MKRYRLKIKLHTATLWMLVAADMVVIGAFTHQPNLIIIGQFLASAAFMIFLLSWRDFLVKAK